jgi:cell division protein FtsB
MLAASRDNILPRVKGFSLSTLLGEKRFRDILGPFLTVCLMVYFIYHIFQGERGLISWLRLQQKIREDEKVLIDLQGQREILERKVYLLRPDSLDRDMLEERVRFLLNFARSDEVVIRDGAPDSVRKN